MGFVDPTAIQAQVSINFVVNSSFAMSIVYYL